MNCCCLVLAAGEGTRMKFDKPKVLSEILFEPMISWILDTVKSCKIEETCVVTGYKSEILENYLENSDYTVQTVFQKERRGTAHAVITAFDFLEKNLEKNVLILGGDSPFMDKYSIIESYKFHVKNNNSATIISSNIENPYGYGRILRDKNNIISSITEEKHLNRKQKKIKEVNSGVYWFKSKDLIFTLKNIFKYNLNKEYYLTSAIEDLIKNKLKVGIFKTNSDVVLGANDPFQLRELNELARRKIIEKHVLNGVNIPFSDSVIITRKVIINKNCKIMPCSIISGESIIGDNCTIGPNAQIENCNIQNNIKIKFSYYKDSNIENSKKTFELIINENKIINI
ncbi:MAG: NTP transferase domain-containing protein [Candidatus Paraimprobicoccus trichonymphae]|uniref:NTP transferase domain-containing protein n=1 Tax=Candidatus Paraimprobicoccus trichonymphae TaxID=3033793 RepID=A0AA48HW05_9FIRM|nr:MAG: NTP transferase domain-containing protein [Candidatus Paraimprobicoccus trichonymphae]